MAGQVKPPFAYYGGKTTLAPKIADLLPAHEHYVEPFAGSLAVLLAKEPTTPPREERERKAIHHGIKRAVFDRDGWECQICGDHKSLVVDHIIPWSKGGPDEMDNYQTLCAPCNTKKRDN